MSAVKEEYSVIYIYPCIVCEKDTESDCELPAICQECA